MQDQDTAQLSTVDETSHSNWLGVTLSSTTQEETRSTALWNRWHMVPSCFALFGLALQRHSPSREGSASWEPSWMPEPGRGQSLLPFELCPV